MSIIMKVAYGELGMTSFIASHSSLIYDLWLNMLIGYGSY